MNSNAKGIIFDLDGTIWDSMPYRIKAWQMAFRDYGIDGDPEIIKLMIGYPGSMLIKKMNARDPNIEMTEEKYFAGMFSEVKFFPDVADTFRKLRTLGFKIAIVTSSRRAMTEKLDITVDAIVTMDDVTNGKPDTEPYRKAMDIMCTSPENTVVVGDIDNDLVPAKTLGSVAVLVTHGTKKESKNKDYEIENIGDLIELLRKMEMV
jgi:HAD superfamily hydrolase (TIGR01509 family)